MNYKKIIITNTWTEIRHGHARAELESVKKLCASLQIQAEIYSEDLGFGDIHRKNYQRRKYIKYEVNSQHRILRIGAKFSLALNLRRLLLQRESKYESAFITSARSNDLWMLLLLPRKKPISIRLIDGPKNGLHSKIFMIIYQLLGRDVLVFLETSSAVELLYQNCRIKLDVLPSIQGLVLQTKQTRNIVAIFWPVSYRESTERMHRIIQQLHSFDLAIRLPRGETIPSDISKNFKIVEMGISDSEFLDICSEVKVAVLPHQDYGTRGSGLMATFAALGKPIVTSRSNNCIEDLVRHGAEIVELDLSRLRADVDSLISVDSKTTYKYREWTLKSWINALGKNDTQF